MPKQPAFLLRWGKVTWVKSQWKSAAQLGQLSVETNTVAGPSGTVPGMPRRGAAGRRCMG
jgi:hypothetical protein